AVVSLHVCYFSPFAPSSLFFFLAATFFFFNDTATPEIYTLSLHDALPIYSERRCVCLAVVLKLQGVVPRQHDGAARRQTGADSRSEEHTSELQSLTNLVCRLLLEKKKTKTEVKTLQRLDKVARSVLDALRR